MKKNNRGFTLIEILLVTSLTLLVATGTLSSLVQGTKLFNRFVGVGLAHDVGFFLEKFTRDLKTSAGYSLIPMEVTRGSISFASLRSTRDDATEVFDAYPVRVTYRHDPEKKVILRTERYPPRFGQREPLVRSEVVAEGIHALEFKRLLTGGAMGSVIRVVLDYGGPTNVQDIQRDISVFTAQGSM